MAKFLYYSGLLSKKVRDSRGKLVGKFNDIVVLDGEDRAEVLALVVNMRNGIKKKVKKIDWSTVESIEKEAIFLRKPLDQIEFNDLENDFLVNHVLLDNQIIDVTGLKVVRVNDLVLSKEGDKFFITNIETGSKGLIRRIGFSNVLRPILNNLADTLIPWSYIAPLEKKTGPTLRLKVERSRVAELHPADIADLMEDLSTTERAIVFTSLDDSKAAETLAESEPRVQRSLVKELKKGRLENILKKMESDEIVDLLQIIPKDRFAEVFKLLPLDMADEVKELLSYSLESAGSIMSTDFIPLPEGLTAGQALTYLSKNMKGLDRVYYIYVVDKEEHLLGMTSLRRLIITDAKKKVSDFMAKRTYHVNPETAIDDVTKIISKYDLLSIPVLDKNNVLVGMVTIDDVLQDVIPEHWKREKFVHHPRGGKQTIRAKN